MIKLQHCKVKGSNELKRISEVDSGLNDRNLLCPSCLSIVMAKKGLKKGHHFAHYRADECKGAGETALHLLSKDVVASWDKFPLPEYKIGKILYQNKQEICFDKYVVEQRISENGIVVIPDILAYYKGHRFAIEMKVTHKVDKEKIEKYRKLGIAAIEIDLSEFKDNSSLDNDNLARCIREAPVFWLHHRRDKLFQDEFDSIKKAYQERNEYKELYDDIACGIYINNEPYLLKSKLSKIISLIEKGNLLNKKAINKFNITPEKIKYKSIKDDILPKVIEIINILKDVRKKYNDFIKSYTCKIKSNKSNKSVLLSIRYDLLKMKSEINDVNIDCVSSTVNNVNESYCKINNSIDENVKYESIERLVSLVDGYICKFSGTVLDTYLDYQSNKEKNVSGWNNQEEQLAAEHFLFLNKTHKECDDFIKSYTCIFEKNNANKPKLLSLKGDLLKIKNETEEAIKYETIEKLIVLLDTYIDKVEEVMLDNWLDHQLSTV